MAKHDGSCHCGAINVHFESEMAPAEFNVLACQCSFCRLHAALCISDPDGTAQFVERQPGTLHRYQFGLRTADYLLCRNCGTYLGAVVMDGDGRRKAIVNIPTLRDRAAFSSPPQSVVYDQESAEDRLARRLRNWTPVID